MSEQVNKYKKYIIDNEFDLFCQECHLSQMNGYEAYWIIETIYQEQKGDYLIYQIVNELSLENIKEIINPWPMPDVIIWFVNVLGEYYHGERKEIAYELVKHGKIPEEIIVNFVGSDFFIDEDIFRNLWYYEPNEKRIQFIVDHSSHETIQGLLMCLISCMDIGAIKILKDSYVNLDMSLDINECIAIVHQKRLCDHCDRLNLDVIIKMVDCFSSLREMGFVFYKKHEIGIVFPEVKKIYDLMGKLKIH